ncbi:hypothetical protein ES703_32466 [subsurface metagenome]
MNDIYLPIDYSNLSAVIPPGEDIIYSTLCKISTLRPYYGHTWNSHVLFTTKGFAYFDLKKEKKSVYLDYFNIKRINKKGFPTGLFTSFIIIRDPNFESREAFNKRIKEFSRTMKVNVENRKKEWELKIPNIGERKKIAKNRKFEMLS